MRSGITKGSGISQEPMQKCLDLGKINDIFELEVCILFLGFLL